jgi:hypothetical protein
MIPKPIDAIGKADVDVLATSAIPEGRSLDYKAELPGARDDDKKEFLADVSSFANAGGGDLIFGIGEAQGVPTSIDGVGVADVNAEVLRLEQIIRDGLAPRLIGVRFHLIDGFAKGPVVVLRVPRSFSAPHMVTFKNTTRFYTRNSAGKYQMDVSEIRTAFNVSESIGERLTRFRDDRLAKIIAGETPIALQPGARLVLHLTPLSSFTLGAYIDSSIQMTMRRQLAPIAGRGWNHRHNLDGFVTFANAANEKTIIANSSETAGSRQYGNSSFLRVKDHPSLQAWRTRNT